MYMHMRSSIESSLPSSALVLRRCLVCDWEGEVIDEPNVDPISSSAPDAPGSAACPRCHAPTERIEVIRRLTNRAGRPANPIAAALGRLGGLKGGPARAAKLSARQRRDIARQAALARWKKG
jgi:hypothetical protein